MVLLIDTGTGNLRSLGNAVRACGFEAYVADSPPDWLPRCAVLPGVGAFGPVARTLREKRWVGYLTRARNACVNILGICLGMQLLFEASEESPGMPGLGFLEGRVRRLDASSAKVPHIGWARLRPAGASPEGPLPKWAYFVHSYAAAPRDASVVTAWADHGRPFPAVVRSGCLAGVQFHPEKSQAPGLAYLRFLLGGAP